MVTEPNLSFIHQHLSAQSSCAHLLSRFYWIALDPYAGRARSCQRLGIKVRL